MITATAWFSAEAERGGVRLTFGDGALDWVWQDPAQAREVIAKIEAALSECDEVRDG